MDRRTIVQSALTLVVGVFGVAVGGAAVVGLGAGKAPAPPAAGNEKTSSPLHATTLSRTPIDQDNDGIRRDSRLAELENRLRLVEEANSKPTEAYEEADIEFVGVKAREHHEKLFQDRITAHRNQPRDPTWSQTMESHLSRELTAANVSEGVSFGTPECKTTSCVTRVQWPSYESARANWQDVVHPAYATSCGRSVFLPEPADPQKPYEATLVFDCSTVDEQR